MVLLRNTYCLFLIFLPSAIASPDDDDDACFNSTLTCNTTSLTNLTNDYGGEDLELEDASNLYEHFNQHQWSTLYCCFYSLPYCANIQWFKDGTELFSANGIREITHGGRLLDMFSPRKTDAGVYSCNATTAYGERMSHVMTVKVQRKCDDELYVEGSPSENPIQVKIGTNQTLQCRFFCYGSNTLSVVSWRNGSGALINDWQKYKRYATKSTSTNINGPNRIESLTVLNFTKSDNISCFTKGRFSANFMFYLVPKTCDGTPVLSPIPSGIEEIVVEEGSNKTLKCQVFCLRNERFGEPKWFKQNGETISNNTVKYKLSRREIGDFVEGRPNYEISLTILNILIGETVFCDLSSATGENTNHTFNLVIKPDTDAVSGEEYFKTSGIWIVIGCILGTLVILVLSLMWFKRRVKRWSIFYRPNNKPEIDAKYDAFISFSEADGGSFVRSTLVPMLEEECGYALSLHYREFIPGTTIVDNITDFIDDSRRIVTIVTPSFLKSEWCRFEVDQGLHRAVERPNTLVMIMLNEIPRVDLPKSLQHFINKVNFLVWNDRQLDSMRQKLIRALGKPLTSEDHEKTGEESDHEEHSVAMDDIAASTNKACDRPNGTFFKDIV